MRLHLAVVVMIAGFSLACGGGGASDAPVVSAEAAAIVAAAPAATDWDGKSTFTCSAMDKKTLRGVTAQVASGPAISASGMCELVIEDCDLSAGVGLEVGGMAKVTMIRGRIDGSEYALYLGGESVTKLEGVTVKGETYKAGVAVLEQSATSTAAAATVAAPAATPTASAAPAPTAAAAPAATSSSAASAAPKAAAPKPAADSGAAALKKKCDGAFSKCKDNAYSDRNSCQNGCVDSSTNTCNSSCESCQSSCVSTYNDKTSSCEKTWNACY